jgi:aromatic ring-opening dioxygenase catalytic subunit (LigB family)
MDDEKLPFVPVFVNDYWSPNQVSPARCYAFGRALRHAIDTFPAELRVAVVATGGLSHFVTNEELDRHVLDALCAGDADALTALPAARLNSGNSEIRNWIALAAACEDKAVTPEAYIPVYRTAAGTGCGLAFATWS